MRAKASRLLELEEAHIAAICSPTPETELFYTDGRHLELVERSPEINAALGIKPWDDDVIGILRAALDLPISGEKNL